ncbi:AEC family transporter [Raineyella sp.]|uniref:AEC family transporter n=1 Tax=bioreactor metagenome TaxID=1076179 RepID=A0A645BL02_9ZZZZ|nr:AEC family transporter [Raineyella sp.]MEA5155688.1 AEC family transporter [Raineyella sp.]
MLAALLQVVLPVAIVALVGMVLARRFVLDADTIGKINLYGLTAPLAFDSLMKTKVTLGEGLVLGGALLLVSALGALLAWAVTFRAPRGTQAGVVGAVVLGNNGNFGLPIALLALGQVGMDQAMILFVVSLVVMFTVGPILMGSGGGILSGLKNFAKLPVTWAMALAGLLRLLGWQLPIGVSRGIELLAAAAVPMVLLALGVQLTQSRRLRLTGPVLTAVGLRVIAFPLIAVGVARLLRMDAMSTSSLVLACAMPTAVNAFMLAREYGSDPETAASAVALSTLLSVGTLTVVISVLPASLV